MTTPMTTQADLQKRAAALSATRDSLTALVRTLEANIQTVKTGSLADIQKVARQVTKQHIELQELINANPALFVKPRTHVVDGLKYGLQKKPGRLDWADDAKLCDRITHLVNTGDISPDQADMLTVTSVKPVARALEKLDAKLLKRLGVTVAADCDEPLIKSVDGEVEKAINAVIKDATKDMNAEVHV